MIIDRESDFMISNEVWELGRFAYHPDKLIVCVSISINPKVENFLATLGEIAHQICRSGIPVLFVKMSRPKPDTKIMASIFLDATNRLNVVKSVVERMKSIKFVDEVKLIEPIARGFTIDNTPRYLTLLDERVVMLGRPCYEALIKGLREKFGSGHKAYLYYVGLEMGRYIYNKLKSMAKEQDDIIPIYQAMFRHLGFGTLEIDLRTRKAIVKDSFECELFKGSNECEGHLVRGMLSGFLSSMLKKEVTTTEIKCIARGDPHCEYVF